MKLLLLCFFTCSLLSFQAQNGPIDFETGGFGATWTWTVFENDDNPALEIIENPDLAGPNSSATVAKFTARVNGEPYAGCESQHTTDLGAYTLAASNSTVTIMVWKPIVSDVGIKLVTTSGGALIEFKVANTLVDQWEELTFDFSSYIDNAIYAIEDVDQIVVFPDFNARTQDNICYFDNITLGEQQVLSGPMEAAPDPTLDPTLVSSLFSNVYTNLPVETWATDWSVADYSELQIDGNDTKKYQALSFVGIEPGLDNLIDLSAADFVHVDIWTPNMTTFRLKLVDFGADGAFDGGDDSEHEWIQNGGPLNSWQSIVIPLSEFSNLNSMTDIAQIIFSGNPAGSGIVYVDNLFFSKTPSGLGELSLSQLQVGPNPTDGRITLTADQSIENVSLYDLQGRQLLQKNFFAAQIELDLTFLAEGPYVLVATTTNGLLTKRIVKH